jgi:hypothetical protein
VEGRAARIKYNRPLLIEPSIRYAVVQLMDTVAVWLIRHCFFPCRIVVCTVCQSYAFYSSHYLFTFLFLCNQPWHGRKIVPSFSFCFDMVELSVYRASHVCGDERNISRLVLQLESAEHLKQLRAALSEAGLSMSVNVNEETPILRVELNTVHL